MKNKYFVWFVFVSGMLLVGHAGFSQVAKTTTENYKADFEKSIDISQFMDYEGKQIPIQILKAGISDEMYEQYPELKEKRVGLGVANISMEYLENLNRFKFTEDKTEIKNRMVKQFQASAAGISENKLDGRGKINLAEYFVTIECYDYSISEDESQYVQKVYKTLYCTSFNDYRMTYLKKSDVLLLADVFDKFKKTRFVYFKFLSN